MSDEDAWTDIELRSALAAAVRVEPCLLAYSALEIDFKKSLELCTSFDVTGCILGWWTINGHGSGRLAEHLREFFDMAFSSAVAKAKSSSFQRRGTTFPLREGDLHAFVDVIKPSPLELMCDRAFSLSWGGQAWTFLAMVALNKLAGYGPCLPSGRWSATERRAAASISRAAQLRSKLDLPLAGLSESDWRKELGNKLIG